MIKNLKLYLGATYLVILLFFLYWIFSYVEINRLNEFLYYKELQKTLELMTSENFLINILLFCFFSIIWVTLLGFGSPLLIISGILFGKWIGTLVSIFSISLGALFLYTIANFFFHDLFYQLLEKKFNKYINLFKRNEFNYFLAFRLAGGLGIPFGIQNILPIIFNIKKTTYFIASLLGFVPMFFIWNTIGSGLNEYVKKSDDFNLMNLIMNKEIYLPIIFFLIMILISIQIKKKFFN